MITFKSPAKLAAAIALLWASVAFAQFPELLNTTSGSADNATSGGAKINFDFNYLNTLFFGTGGTLTSPLLVSGSLGFSGTGTITASNLNCPYSVVVTGINTAANSCIDLAFTVSGTQPPNTFYTPRYAVIQDSANGLGALGATSGTYYGESTNSYEWEIFLENAGLLGNRFGRLQLLEMNGAPDPTDTSAQETVNLQIGAKNIGYSYGGVDANYLDSLGTMESMNIGSAMQAGAVNMQAVTLLELDDNLKAGSSTMSNVAIAAGSSRHFGTRGIMTDSVVSYGASNLPGTGETFTSTFANIESFGKSSGYGPTWRDGTWLYAQPRVSNFYYPPIAAFALDFRAVGIGSGDGNPYGFAQGPTAFDNAGTDYNGDEYASTITTGAIGNLTGTVASLAIGPPMVGQAPSVAWSATGYISGTTLTICTINAPTDGSASPINVGNLVIGTAVGTGTQTTAGTKITGVGTGTGALGTYTVNNSQTLGTASCTTGFAQLGGEIIGGSYFGQSLCPTGSGCGGTPRPGINIAPPPPQATFVGSISSNTLTVSSVTAGALANGMTLFDYGQGNIAAGTTITGSGTSWTTSGSPQTVASEVMTAGTGVQAIAAPATYVLTKAIIPHLPQSFTGAITNASTNTATLTIGGLINPLPTTAAQFTASVTGASGTSATLNVTGTTLVGTIGTGPLLGIGVPAGWLIASGSSLTWTLTCPAGCINISAQAMSSNPSGTILSTNFILKTSIEGQLATVTGVTSDTIYTITCASACSNVASMQMSGIYPGADAGCVQGDTVSVTGTTSGTAATILLNVASSGYLAGHVSSGMVLTQGVSTTAVSATVGTAHGAGDHCTTQPTWQDLSGNPTLGFGIGTLTLSNAGSGYLPYPLPYTWSSNYSFPRDLPASFTPTLTLAAAALPIVSPVQWAGAPFTLSGGTGTCASTSTLKGGTQAGKFTATGTTGTCAVKIVMPTAQNDVACFAYDFTHYAAASITAQSTTGCTISVAATANDVIYFFTAEF